MQGTSQEAEHPLALESPSDPGCRRPARHFSSGTGSSVMTSSAGEGLRSGCGEWAGVRCPSKGIVIAQMSRDNVFDPRKIDFSSLPLPNAASHKPALKTK